PAVPPERLLAFLAMVGTMLVARDLYLDPAELFAVHTLAKVRWPPQIAASGLFLGAGVAFSAALGLGLAAPRRPWARWLGWGGVTAAVATALLFSAVLTHGLVPALSRHLSRRAAVDTYRRAAVLGEPLARYRVEGDGAAAWHAAP